MGSPGACVIAAQKGHVLFGSIRFRASLKYHCNPQAATRPLVNPSAELYARHFGC